MKVTRSLAGITNKQVLLGLADGHVYGLHKQMFDARRCGELVHERQSLQSLVLNSKHFLLLVVARPADKKSAEKNVGLPPYRPIIDVATHNLLNYNQVRGGAIKAEGKV